ncbi:cystathionine gamma-synthase [Aspergillus pseudotamarii]|uniref:Cystathionine gamma-synthase n=1 Tax=Aspergillus pseudotamarii TaxID=132259 RepID=A0A5N6T0N5_ASPPS|nr:cystathionine gamma-synthase [Aspergillus pseudotamarii]KAE8139124.1 cystathionine gamma-synthase [Aspergillus pseudotamarii]
MSDDSLATQVLHADNDLDGESDIAPPIHLSTTFRYLYNADQDESLPGPALGNFCYSRDHAPTRTRLETVLSALIRGPTLTYASGLAAVHAYLVFLKPKRIAIGEGYYGSRQVANLHQQLTGCEILSFDQLDALQEGDVIHLETPINPTGEALSIKRFADEAHKRGAYLVIDSTFGPPGLQDPFALGADIIMHSGTKYFGGHHDLLCGTLSIPPSREGAWFKSLHEQRTILGSVLGSMEVWLGLRSLRTLELRVQRQSANATGLVRWLDECLKGESENVVRSTVAVVRHASLQVGDMDWLREQMPHGFGPVFAIEMKTEEMSRKLTGLLRLFQHATSLGGVESQIEWRRLVDASATPTLLRVSIGVEYLEDLKRDLLQGFEALMRT